MSKTESIATTDDIDLLCNRFIPSFRVKNAQGPYLFMESGDCFVDYLLGNCCNFLGHSNERIIEAVSNQLQEGSNVGDFSVSAAYRLAQRICRLSNKDCVRFVNSGSEAVHLAIRLARYKTKRKKVIKFIGHYHGWFDEEIDCFLPEMPAEKKFTSQNIISLKWNDKLALKKVFQEKGNEIAAVICEPVLYHAGPVPPVDGFLSFIQTQCSEANALLIFDECITGFRLALGGAQAIYKVSADLVIYSKAMASGFPIAALAGKKPVMENLVSDVYQAGTYDANPISVAAANATLDVLESDSVYSQIAQQADTLKKEISFELNKKGIPFLYQGFPSAFQFFFTQSDILTDYKSVLDQVDLKLHFDFYKNLLDQGVFVFPGVRSIKKYGTWISQWFLSAAHDFLAIEKTMDGVKKCLSTL